MVRTYQEIPNFESLEYDYGNQSPLSVIHVKPNLDNALDAHGSLNLESNAQELFTEPQLEEKITELVDNYDIVGDPQSTEAAPRQTGLTIGNKHNLRPGAPTMLIMSTNGSAGFNDKGEPVNAGNFVETAYACFKYPDHVIVYAESPGTGNSTDFDSDEYAAAGKNGKLVTEEQDDAGKLIDYEAFQTVHAIRRSLESAGLHITHTSANASGAHILSALETTLPKDSLQRSFMYNPTNVSDRNPIAAGVGSVKEILAQGKYKKLSKDPLQLTPERIDMAKRVMGAVDKTKFTGVPKSTTHGLRKLWNQNFIFVRGNEQGQSAAVHTVASHLQHPSMRKTIIFPEFASQYKSPEDFVAFMNIVERLGGEAISATDEQTLKIPLGQYGHSHYPTVRQTFEGYSFNR